MGVLQGCNRITDKPLFRWHLNEVVNYFGPGTAGIPLATPGGYILAVAHVLVLSLTVSRS